ARIPNPLPPFSLPPFASSPFLFFSFSSIFSPPFFPSFPCLLRFRLLSPSFLPSPPLFLPPPFFSSASSLFSSLFPFL
ncbi:hypothetical protein ACXWRS_12240, partial [Streptococcus pyogenes]